MAGNFIIEDFPMSQIEFENRFNTEQACMDYLAKMKWPDGFYCRPCGDRANWISSKRLFICLRFTHQNFFILIVRLFCLTLSYPN